MNKNIWLINHYAGGMLFDCGGRHYNFAKYLKRAGYAPVVFACNAIHGKAETFFPDTALWQEHMAEEINVPFVYVRGWTYSGNGKQRILNMIDFYRNVKKTAKEYAKLHGKPDIIFASSVHPLTLVAGIQLAKKFGVKCICEVRDLWPESIVAYSSRLDRKNPVIRLLYQGEKWIYKKANSLVFTMEGAYDYIVEQGWEKEIPRAKVHYINNGVDLEQFYHNYQQHPIKDADLSNSETFKVVYTGSIRQVNHLGLLLDAAKKVENSKIQFLIWGDGTEREMLERRIADENITNVIFKGRVEKQYVPYIVSHADLNFAHNAPQSLFRFGISFNKIFDYLAAGKPILCDFPCAYNPVIQWGAGVSVQEATPSAIAETVDQMAGMSNGEYETYCEAARKAAQEFDFKVLTEKLIHVIEGMS